MVTWLLIRGLAWAKEFIEVDVYNKQAMLHNIYDTDELPTEEMETAPVDADRVKVCNDDIINLPPRDVRIATLLEREPAFKDPDRGPRRIWGQCYHNDDYRDEAWLLEWGWALWDEQRLRNLGVLNIGTVTCAKIHLLPAFRTNYSLTLNNADDQIQQFSLVAKDTLIGSSHFGYFFFGLFQRDNPTLAQCEDLEFVFQYHYTQRCPTCLEISDVDMSGNSDDDDDQDDSSSAKGNDSSDDTYLDDGDSEDSEEDE